MLWWVKDCKAHMDSALQSWPCAVGNTQLRTSPDQPCKVKRSTFLKDCIREMISIHTSRSWVFRPSIIKFLYSRLSNYNNYHNSQPFYLAEENPNHKHTDFLKAAPEMLERGMWGMNTDLHIRKSDTERINTYSMLQIQTKMEFRSQERSLINTTQTQAILNCPYRNFTWITQYFTLFTQTSTDSLVMLSLVEIVHKRHQFTSKLSSIIKFIIKLYN